MSTSANSVNAAGQSSQGAASGLNVRQVASLLGRNQGPEFFWQQGWTALGSGVIPKNVNLNRPLERFHIVWQGRIVIATAAITTLAPEGLAAMALNNLKLQGTHNQYGAQVPINLTGPDIFAWPSLFRTRGCSLYINGAIQNPLSQPAGLVTTIFGNVGTYDIEIHFDLPLVPIFPAAAKLNAVPFLYQQANWGNTLQLQYTFGDQTCFGTLGTATFTFTSYGSGSGTPQIYFFTNYEILGALADSIASAVVVRTTLNVAGGVLTANSSTLQRLALLQKYKTTNIVIKTGTNLTTTSPGVSAFLTLSDLILQQTQVIADNKPIRNNFLNRAAQEYAGYAFDARIPQGYLPFTFVDSMNPQTAFPANKLSGGSIFEVDSQVIGAAGTNIGEVIQEYYLGVPAGKS
jgi:hypothetical protein